MYQMEFCNLGAATFQDAHRAWVRPKYAARKLRYPSHRLEPTRLLSLHNDELAGPPETCPQADTILTVSDARETPRLTRR